MGLNIQGLEINCFPGADPKISCCNSASDSGARVDGVEFQKVKTEFGSKKLLAFRENILNKLKLPVSESRFHRWPQKFTAD